MCDKFIKRFYKNLSRFNIVNDFEASLNNPSLIKVSELDLESIYRGNIIGVHSESINDASDFKIDKFNIVPSSALVLIDGRPDLTLSDIDSIISEITELYQNNINIYLNVGMKEDLDAKYKVLVIFIDNNMCNEEYTFDTFESNDNNRIAFLSAYKVAKNPGSFANPFYIYGKTGAGKTHLMKAIGNYIVNNDANKKVVYVQMNDYISDYTTCKNNEFRFIDEKYNNADILLVDDVNLLSDKLDVQHHFFKLFNELLNKDKQVVITSNVPANKLNGCMDCLISRLLSSFTVNIY